MWQQIYGSIEDGRREVRSTVLTIAIDAQGTSRIRPFVEAADASFEVLVDEGSVTPQLFGFRTVPTCLLIDGSGIVRYSKFGGFDIRDSATRSLVEGWLSHKRIIDSQSSPSEFSNAEAYSEFRNGLVALRRGDRRTAAQLWSRALELEPDNHLIQSQLWAAEHPDKFYDGPVDLDWQSEQIGDSRNGE